jgi:hypothetical protein
LNFKAIYDPLGGWVGGGGGWLVKSDFIALFGHHIGWFLPLGQVWKNYFTSMFPFI